MDGNSSESEERRNTWVLSIRQPLLTHLQGPLERPPPENFDVARQPGNHVSGDVRAAVSHGLDLHRLQNAVPDVDLAQLAHERLTSIEAAADHVLRAP